MNRFFLKRWLWSTALVASVMLAPLDAQAMTGWSTTKVATAGQTPYCAVSRRIDNTTLTIGRTTAGQSSLAIDMPGANLDPSQSYRVSIRPGRAERLEIETRPINTQTLVLNVDKAVDLTVAFREDSTLLVEYLGRTISLNLPDWSRAADDLSACLSGLNALQSKVAPVPAKDTQPKIKAPVATSAVPAVPAVPVAPVVSAPVVDDSPRLAVMNEENRKLRDELALVRGAQEKATAAIYAERDQLLAQVQTLQIDLDRTKALQQSVSASASEKLRTSTDQVAQISTMRAEIVSLRGQLNTARQSPVGDNAAFDAEKSTLKAELASLRDQLKAAHQTPAVAPATLDAEKSALTTERDRLARENTTLQQQLTGQKSQVADVKKLADEIAKLKVEKGTLETKLDTAMEARPKQTATNEAATASLEAELTELKVQLDLYKNKPKSPEMADLQRRMEMLSAENVKLRADLTSATTSDSEVKVAVAAEAPLRQQLRTLVAENGELKAKVDELGKLLDGKQNQQDKTLIGAAGKDWDLEKATRRLQETERDVQRLSLSMRTTKEQCEAEKKQIEYMLFDPKLAKDGQIALLNSLEDQIAELRAIKGVPPPAPTVAVESKSAMAKATPILEGTITPPAVSAEPLPAVGGGEVADVKSAGATAFTNLLRDAGVTLSKSMVPVPKNPFGPGKAWAYESGELAGLAVEQAAIKPDKFDGVAKTQMARLKSTCKGDFAFQPAADQTKMGLKYIAYDAACIHGADSTSAAVLFFQRNGAFNIISYEVGPDSMSKAMEARDRLIAVISK